MMGQQETMTVAEKEAGSALRRIVLALTVAAVMALTMSSLAANPAQAKNCYWEGTMQECRNVTETPSGNVNDTYHFKYIKDGPAQGGGAEVDNGNDETSVHTPANNYNNNQHQKRN